MTMMLLFGFFSIDIVAYLFATPVCFMTKFLQFLVLILSIIFWLPLLVIDKYNPSVNVYISVEAYSFYPYNIPRQEIKNSDGSQG